MKMVEIKDGSKTRYKIVPDDWVKEEKKETTGDLTTSGRKCIGFSDIDKEKWDKIFKNG